MSIIESIRNLATRRQESDEELIVRAALKEAQGIDPKAAEVESVEAALRRTGRGPDHIRELVGIIHKHKEAEAARGRYVARLAQADQLRAKEADLVTAIDALLEKLRPLQAELTELNYANNFDVHTNVPTAPAAIRAGHPELFPTA